MTLLLKRLKTLPLTDESEPFTADVYEVVSGLALPRGIVSDDGHGGCYIWSDHQFLDRVAAYCATLPKVKMADGFVLRPDPDILIDQLLDRMAAEKTVTRVLQTRVVWLDHGELFQSRIVLAPITLIPHIAARYPNATIVNLLPFDDAVALFLAQEK